MEVMDVANHVIAVSPTIRVWTETRYDRQVSDEIAVQKSVSRNAGRYNKNLLPEGAESLKAVQRKARAIRGEHYQRTLPLYEGVQVLRVEGYFAYAKWWNTQEAEYQALVDVFVQEYPQLVTRAKKALGSMWRAEDYPHPSTIANRFGLSINVFPLPAGTQFEAFVTELGSEVVAGLKSNLEEEQKRMIKSAMDEAWHRLYSAVKRIHEKCSIPIGAEGSVFRDTLIGNLLQLVDTLPILNLTGDENLTQLAELAREELVGRSAGALHVGTADKAELAEHSANVLRTNAVSREAAAAKAADIMKAMEAFMTPNSN